MNGDGRYVNLDDKKFIGYDAPRYRLGMRNDVTFLKNFTASVFIRADLGHIGAYDPALNRGYESNDRWSRNNGPVPYWTADRPDDEYARLNPIVSAFGGWDHDLQTPVICADPGCIIDVQPPRGSCATLKAEQPADVWLVEESCNVYGVARLGS